MSAYGIEDSQDRSYECKWKGCSEELNSSEELKDHIENFHLGRKKSHYKCEWSQCHFGQRRKLYDLKTHVTLHHQHLGYLCKHCGKGFLRDQELRKHIVTGCPEQYTTQKAIAKVKEIKEIREKVKVKLEEPVETNTCKKRVRNDSFDGTMIKKEKVELFDLYEVPRFSDCSVDEVSCLDDLWITDTSMVQVEQGLDIDLPDQSFSILDSLGLSNSDEDSDMDTMVPCSPPSSSTYSPYSLSPKHIPSFIGLSSVTPSQSQYTNPFTQFQSHYSTYTTSGSNVSSPSSTSMPSPTSSFGTSPSSPFSDCLSDTLSDCISISDSPPSPAPGPLLDSLSQPSLLSSEHTSPILTTLSNNNKNSNRFWNPEKSKLNLPYVSDLLNQIIPTPSSKKESSDISDSLVPNSLQVLSFVPFAHYVHNQTNQQAPLPPPMTFSRKSNNNTCLPPSTTYAIRAVKMFDKILKRL